MYAQVYLHPVRRIYDIHLKEFLQQWLPNERFSLDPKTHLKTTDTEVLSAIRRVAATSKHVAHEAAKRIASRQHYRHLFSPKAAERSQYPKAFQELVKAAQARYPGQCRMDSYTSKTGATQFQVLLHDGQIESSIVRSSTLSQAPQLAVDYLFIDPTVRDDAQSWLKSERSKIYPPEAVAKPGERDRDKATGPAHHDESPATSPPVRHRRNRQKGGIPPDRNDA